MAKASVCFAARMNVTSRAMTSSPDCSPWARKNTERLSIDEMVKWLAKADNAIGATHTRWKCLIRLQDEIRDWGNSVIQLMSDYLRTLRDRGVYRRVWTRYCLTFPGACAPQFSAVTTSW